MPVEPKNRWAYKIPRGQRYTLHMAELKRYSQAHDGTAGMGMGAWRKFVGAAIGKAIDNFVAEHGYTPRQDDLSISVEFTSFEILIMVRDIYNLECMDHD